MICGTTMPKHKQRLCWHCEMKAAKKAMDLYPVGSDEREIYRNKYNDAVKHYTPFLQMYTESERRKRC